MTGLFNVGPLLSTGPNPEAQSVSFDDEAASRLWLFTVCLAALMAVMQPINALLFMSPAAGCSSG